MRRSVGLIILNKSAVLDCLGYPL